MADIKADISAVIRKAVEVRDMGEPVEFAVLRTCREFQKGEHLDLFTRTMNTIANHAQLFNESWERAAISIASSKDNDEEYHSLKDVDESLRQSVWDRLQHGRRGIGKNRK